MARLGDIATVITKGTTPTSIGFEFQSTGVNFIKIESITEDGIFLPQKFDHINAVCNEAMKRSQLQKNDILFSIAGAIGRTAIVNESVLPANTNQALAIIRIPEGVINYKFLLYALQAPSIKKQFEKQKQGVAQLNISLKDVSDFIVPMLSMHEQEHIVAVLDSVNHIIVLRKQQLAKLDELVKARFVEMFGSIDNPKYGTQKIKELVDVCSGGTPKRDNDLYWNDGSIPWVKTTELKNNVITVIEECITVLGLRESSAKLVPAGTVLIAMYGQGKTRGMTGYLGVEASTNQACACLLSKNLVNQKYLWHYLILSYEKLRELAQGGNQPNLNADMIKNFDVIMPPPEEQNAFVEFTEQIDKSKLTIQQSLAKLEMLQKMLMQKYFG